MKSNVPYCRRGMFHFSPSILECMRGENDDHIWLEVSGSRYHILNQKQRQDNKQTIRSHIRYGYVYVFEM